MVSIPLVIHVVDELLPHLVSSLLCVYQPLRIGLTWGEGGLCLLLTCPWIHTDGDLTGVFLLVENLLNVSLSVGV